MKNNTEKSSRPFINLEEEKYTAIDIAGLRLDQTRSIHDQPDEYTRIVDVAYRFLSVFEPFRSVPRSLLLAGSQKQLDMQVLRNLGLLDRDMYRTMEIVAAMTTKEKSGYYRPWISYDVEGEDGYAVSIGYAGRYGSYNQMLEHLMDQEAELDDVQGMVAFLPREEDVPHMHEAFYVNNWHITPDGLSEKAKTFTGCQFHVDAFKKDFPLVEEGSVGVELMVPDEPSARAVNRLLISVFSPFVDFKKV